MLNTPLLSPTLLQFPVAIFVVVARILDFYKDVQTYHVIIFYDLSEKFLLPCGATFNKVVMDMDSNVDIVRIYLFRKKTTVNH